MIGRTIGSFQLVENLGEGALGTVYRAVDQVAQRDAAIEILRPEYSQNADLNARLRAESSALSRVVNPAIATCYGFYRDGDDGFLLTEFIPGETLQTRLQRVGGLPWQAASDLVLQSLDGLKQAHDAGILHGDVRPANIMVTPDTRVKLKNFGIARLLNTVGPEYLAPECVLGNPPEARSDLYSLGLVFYQMLTGRMAFQGATPADVLRAHVEEAAKLPSELGIQIPQPVEQALMRALAKKPEYRHADAGAFATQLRDAMGKAAVGNPPAGIATAQMSVPVPPPPAAAFAPPPPPAPAAAFVPQGPPPPAAKSPVAAQKSGGGSKKGLWIGLAAAVVLIGGSAGGYFALKDRWKPQPKPVAQTEPAPPQAAPAPAPAPTAETQPPPSAEPAATGPTTPPVQPKPAAAAAPTAVPSANRAAVLAALEQTDGPVPAGAASGSRPLHYAGVLKATRIPGSAPIVLEAVQNRGVNFHLNTKQIFALRQAGAQDPLIQMLPGAYRGEAAAASSAPAPVAAQAPPPSDPAPPPPPPPSSNTPSSAPTSAPAPVGPPLQHLREIRKILVQSKETVLDEDLKTALQTELGTRVAIVQNAAAADAILRIQVVEDQTGKVGRAFGVKNKHKATAQVVEKRQGKVLWTTEVGDREDMAGEGARRIASRIAKQLRKDWEK